MGRLAKLACLPLQKQMADQNTDPVTALNTNKSQNKSSPHKNIPIYFLRSQYVPPLNTSLLLVGR